MPSPRTRAATRRDVYAEVTNRIIAQLEAGVAPWVQPWDGTHPTLTAAPAALPVNASTGATYRGVNVLLLWIATCASGYPTNRYMTYRQAQQLGGQVRRGEAATMIIKLGQFVPRAERERVAHRDADAPGRTFLKTYAVFNIAQIDGLPDETTAPPPPPDITVADGRVRAILERLGTRNTFGHVRACYVPAIDAIHLPSREAFGEGGEAAFGSVALHEAAHATGAPHRLDRDLTGWFGGEDYAREELVAEMAAAFACAALGIVPRLRHADYIGAWLNVLRGDKRCIVRAASAASRAADYLLDLAMEATDASPSSWGA